MKNFLFTPLIVNGQNEGFAGEICSNSDYAVLINSHYKVSTEIKNDYWNLYCYGRQFKIVYHKVGKLAHNEFAKANYQKKSAPTDNERFSSSIARAKAKIFEIASCNEFSHFCTFTQDEKKRDRFDLSAFRKDLTMLVRNLNRSREDKIKYLLIPEKHKNGAWHLHGLFMGLTSYDLTPFSLSEKLPYKIRNSIKKGEKVYNWRSYSQKFGYFTATDIKDDIAVSKYITKYITKEIASNVLESNKHLYFASQGLKRKECLIENCFEPCPLQEWSFENDYVKIATFTLDDIKAEKLSLLFMESKKGVKKCVPITFVNRK